ncbi:PqqD family peptide modification chaperone [Polynucleobacter sp. MG-28-Ekke-A2]|uniref:PqqD family peptide modification chaperone n=1 Tax=Polynucleobacter sp. MG-28-Ekke-A2 TaxID=3108276 RepID=UPI002B23B713|nr:PqqD family peptide modification chaperone [Polynucleobacter sp. MG-28-Ekke-A2]MEA9601207.1 PqqD family peptide modification chaperone [Polynucleobacter sp. MG-28-Ekke-A2]
MERLYDSASLRAWLIEDHLITAQFPKPELQVWNPTASALWLLLLDGGYKLEDLASQISKLFAISSPAIEIQVNACLSDWVQRNWAQLDNEGRYSISSKISDSTSLICYVDTPEDSVVIFDKNYFLNDHSFRLRVRAFDNSRHHPFLTRLTAITQGFFESSIDHKSQLDIVIDSECIFVGENSQGYKKYQDSAEALNNCIQYFLKISAGETAHFITFHAAALGRENGLLFSGISGAGKSTLCALLAQKGWRYYGDDLVGLSVNF